MSWLLCVVPLVGSAAESRAKSATPYFEAYAAGEKVENLPLTMTRVDATIVGVGADVAVVQSYENRGDKPIEAVYVFPASSRATVYAVKMTIGTRVIEAELRERQAARATYEQAKSEGRSATLLEQQDVDAFRMSVANVLPGDRIDVELRYVELLVPTDGVYEFFFPNTAPQVKYSRPGDPDSAMPRSSDPAVSAFALSIDAAIAAPTAIASLDSPSHRIAVRKSAPNEARLTVEDDDGTAATRDFVLRYTLRGDAIAVGALAYPEGDGGYLLVMAQPPQRPDAALVPPREYIFVVDVSGSMNGQPLDVSKRLIRDLFSTLKPTDRFNVVLFAGGSRVLSPSGSLPATPETLKRAIAAIDATDAGGGTELASALQTAYDLPETPGMSRTMVIVTDGAIAAGGDVSKLIRGRLDRANAFTFGVGEWLNASVLERLARAGEGELFLVSDGSKGEEVAGRMRAYIDRPLMTKIQTDWGDNRIYDMLPGRVPDLFAERPIVVLARYRGTLADKVVFSGFSGDRPMKVEVDLRNAIVRPDLRSLRRLWARRAIDDLLDGDCVDGGCNAGGPDSARDKIVALGLEHGVMTPFTSFVAVTSEVRTQEQATRVDQPAVARRVAPLVTQSGQVGYGFTPEIAAMGLRIATAPSTRDPFRAASAGDEREVDGRTMRLIDGMWRDRAHRQDATVLRVRRDSAAYRELLRLRPDLETALSLGERVLIAFGRYSILVSPEGFGDFPDGVLRRAVGRG
ncbi:MAG: VWA domain-containing protein [Lysobacter sp.]|nr:VWA domain-containing protein [Lysobacter sp.]